jgi:hypothetical protein
MQSELAKVTAEIEEATRCMGDGLDDQAADHLAVAATLLDALITGSSSESAAESQVLGRRVAA